MMAMMSEVIRIQATIQASRNGRPRTSGVARLTKNGPTMRARKGTTASQRILRMHKDSWVVRTPPVAKNYLPPPRKFRQDASTLVATEQARATLHSSAVGII